jgi:hypothetical protein
MNELFNRQVCFENLRSIYKDIINETRELYAKQESLNEQNKKKLHMLKGILVHEFIITSSKELYLEMLLNEP